MHKIDTGIIFRNPKPHVKSIHAYFPSVVKMDNGEMLACIALAEAFESVDMHTHILRSSDSGITWQYEGELFQKDNLLVSDSSRFTALPGGEVAAFTMAVDRSAHPDDGLASHETMGFAPTTLQLRRSSDYGKTFSAAQIINPSIEGPEFEMCSPITPLSDGRWILPTSTWRSWDGYCPGGMRMVALVSSDSGCKWPAHWEVMNAVDRKIIFWESKIAELPGGTLLAVAWAYDEANTCDLPNHFAISHDRGLSWSIPMSTGIYGQTLTPLVMPDGDILCIYRRIDQPGLWASRCRISQDNWQIVDSIPLWGWQSTGLTKDSQNMAQNFNVLRFGAPCAVLLDNSTVYVAFWCYEDCVSNIRWIKLAY